MTSWPSGYDLLVLDSVDSTNQEARRRSASTCDPLWIMARAQSSGRGRRGRDWVSGQGNLYATLLIRRAVSPSVAARYSFHAALAVADTLRVLAPAESIGIKWPNDVLLNGRKTSGILLESLGTHDHLLSLAIGIGLNLAGVPEVSDALFPPTSVQAETREVHEPNDVLAILARRLDHWLAIDVAEGFLPVRSAWRSRVIGVGEQISIRLPDKTLQGTFRDVDAEGLLVLETVNGLQNVAAGDVFFPRPA